MNLNQCTSSCIVVFSSSRLLGSGVAARGRREYFPVGLTPASMLATPLTASPEAKIQACRIFKFWIVKTIGNINSMLKLFLLCLLLGSQSNGLQAAPRDAGKPDSGAVLKLQAMVKSLTGERDAAKAESAKMAAEIEQLKKENKEKADKIGAAEAAKLQVDSELAAQKTSAGRVQETLDKTHERLLEVIEKHKEVTQSKNELSNELAALKNTQQATAQQLTLCTEHNVKLYQSGKDLLEHYQSKGTVGAMLQDEPLLQFNSVEMENIIQDYEDKLNSGVYKTK